MKSSHANMLIYLKGTRSTELNNLIDFLYNGEAFIPQEELKVFLETGREFKVKGLQCVLTGVGEIVPEDTKHHKTTYEYSTNEDDLDHKSISDQRLLFASSNDAQGGNLVKLDEDQFQLNRNELRTFDFQIEQMIEKNESAWKCKVCGKTNERNTALRKHVEIHIDGMTLACHICNKTFSNRPNLTSHISKYHSGMFSCDICEKSAMNRVAYNRHKRTNH